MPRQAGAGWPRGRTCWFFALGDQKGQGCAWDCSSGWTDRFEGNRSGGILFCKDVGSTTHWEEMPFPPFGKGWESIVRVAGRSASKDPEPGDDSACFLST